MDGQKVIMQQRRQQGCSCFDRTAALQLMQVRVVRYPCCYSVLSG
jgi:hypothetical protein